jgi:hypothetical protein
MPKKTTSKKVAKPRLPKVNKWVLGLIIILLPFLIYFLIVRPLQINHQRNQFKKAEVQLNSLADQIQAKIGKADQAKTEKSCSYQSQAYGKGPRSCNARVSLLYPGKDAAEANRLMQEVSSFGKPDLRNSRGSSAPLDFSDAVDKRSDQVFYQSIPELSGISCGFQYIYPVVTRLASPFHPQTIDSLELDISCHGSAMAEFYPVQN